MFDRSFDSSGTGVRVIYKGDSPEQRDRALEKALSQLKKLMDKEGITREMKERQYFKSRGRKNYEQRRTAQHKRLLKLKKRMRPHQNKFKKFHQGTFK